MYYSLYLSTKNDLDLISMSAGKRLSKLVIDALKAYVREQELSIDVDSTITFNEVPRDKKRITVNLYLNDKKDRDIVDFLLGIRLGYRCQAIKNILRSYLSTPIISVYLNDHGFIPKTNPTKPKPAPITKPTITEETVKIPSEFEQKDDTGDLFSLLEDI